MVGAVLALGACGAETGGPSAGTLVSASVEKTTGSTAHMDGDVFVVRGDQSAKVQEMEGAMDFDARRSSLTMTSLLSHFEPGAADQYIDVVSADGVAYERIDGLELPPGKEWVAIRPSDLGVDGQTVASVGSGDPADGLSFLEGVSDARETGEEDVRGTPTTKYTVSMDLEPMLDLLRKGSQKVSPQFGRMLEVLRDRIDVRHLPGAVWLDDAGRVRRFRYSMLTSGKRATGSTVDMQFYDFGEPVQIAVPPAEKTVPYSEAADAMRDFLGGALTGAGTVGA
jgi:hypothetical protein